MVMVVLEKKLLLQVTQLQLILQILLVEGLYRVMMVLVDHQELL